MCEALPPTLRGLVVFVLRVFDMCTVLAGPTFLNVWIIEPRIR